MRQNKLTQGLLISLLITTASLALEKDTQNFSTINNTKDVTSKKKVVVEKHTFNGSTYIGLGYDSNPYQTPNSPYNDYTRTAINNSATYITPVVQSGLFVPISLKADYEYRYKKDIRFIGDFKYSGKYFSDKALTNANESKAQAKAGVRYRLNKYKKEVNKIEFNTYAGHVHKIYVDRDDGTLKATPIGGDQSNRYQYTKVGSELSYTYDYKNIDIFLRALRENRNYATPASWSSLDHTHTRVKAEGGYQFTKALHLGAYYEYVLRDYSLRKSYDTDAVTGIIKLNKPGVNFTYNDVKVSADYKYSKKYKISLDYLLSQRKDDNQGYADYLYHSITLSNGYKFSKLLRTSVKLNYFMYDYKNAYAYDNDTNYEKKETQGSNVTIDTKYKITKEWISSLKLNYKDVTSTDKRYEYNQIVALATIKYIF